MISVLKKNSLARICITLFDGPIIISHTPTYIHEYPIRKHTKLPFEWSIFQKSFYLENAQNQYTMLARWVMPVFSHFESVYCLYSSSFHPPMESPKLYRFPSLVRFILHRSPINALELKTSILHRKFLPDCLQSQLAFYIILTHLVARCSLQEESP